ncbi:inorganic diphosphatase [Vulgatibacter incomptus]|uniref:Inorganic pyrophosphatase n=1 Tax=Vulgatibacter incomptus TaxID=1391653 RepID=A0A0K1PFB2_9BACT|nr:inorganic diphosphatase [Vulgatibacter incomptus]AKU92208.1 Inorganic pyrophosphatase [Vulgatibacter incomptus]
MAYHPWHDVELPENLEDPIPAIIEIPMGSKVKYELDKVSGLLMVDRILFSAVYYPANYGFVPRTYCDDGDPLDVLVFCQEPIASLAMMRAKVIGVMKMRDEKGEDDKLIAVHADDPEYASYSDLWQLPPHRLREIKRFFEDYKALERKTVVVSDPLGRREALAVLRDGIDLYNKNRPELIANYQAGPPSAPVTSKPIMPSVEAVEPAPAEKPVKRQRKAPAKAAAEAPPAPKAKRSRKK